MRWTSIALMIAFLGVTTPSTYAKELKSVWGRTAAKDEGQNEEYWRTLCLIRASDVSKKVQSDSRYLVKKEECTSVTRNTDRGYVVLSYRVLFEAEKKLGQVYETHLGHSGLSLQQHGQDSFGAYSQLSDCLDDLVHQEEIFQKLNQGSLIDSSCMPTPRFGSVDQEGFVMTLKTLNEPQFQLWTVDLGVWAGGNEAELLSQMTQLLEKQNNTSVVFASPEEGRLWYYTDRSFKVDRKLLSHVETTASESWCKHQEEVGREIFEQMENGSFHVGCYDAPEERGSRLLLLSVGNYRYSVETPVESPAEGYFTFEECESDRLRIVRERANSRTKVYGGICTTDFLHRDHFKIDLYQARY